MHTTLKRFPYYGIVLTHLPFTVVLPLVLAAQVRELGSEPHVLPITDDTQLHAAVESTLAMYPELLLILSGSSAGSKDFASRIVNELGQLFVHGVAVHLGYPMIIGVIGGIPVLGVPSYLVRADLIGEIFMQPLLVQIGFAARR